MKLDFKGINWRFIGQVGGLTILFTYLWLFNSTNYDFMDAGKMLVGVILLCVIGLIWIIRGNHAANPIKFPLIIYVGVFILTSLTSIDSRRSLGEGLYLLVSVFILTITMEISASGVGWRRIFLALAISGGIVMIFLWMPVIFWYRDWLASSSGQFIPDIIYRLPTATVNSFFLNVLMFLGFAGILGFKSLAGKIVSAVYLAPVIGLSFFASSRAAWLGELIGFLLLAFFFYRRNSTKILNVWRFLRLRWGLTILIIIVGIIEAVGGGFLLYRQTIHPTHGDVASSRAGLWGPAFPTILQYPVLGQGPFTYQISFVRAESVPPKEFFPHAHNVILNILAEMGIIGLLAFLVVYFAGWKTLIHQIRSRNPEDKPGVWAAAAILAVFSIQGFFDSYHIDPMGLWAMLIMCGAAVGEPIVRKKVSFIVRPWWILILIVAAILNYLVFKPYSDGVAAADHNDWKNASLQLGKAIQIDPNNAINQQQYGLVESVLAKDGNPATLDLAIRSFEQAVRLDPNWAQNHIDLGLLYLKRNQNSSDLDAGINELKKAVHLAPDSDIFWLNLGIAQENSGDRPGASQAYERVLSINPDLIDAYFWRSTSLRAEVGSSWRQKNPIKSDLSLSELERAVTTDPSYANFRTDLAEALLQAGRISDAKAQLQQAQLSVNIPGISSLQQEWLNAEIIASSGKISEAAQSGQHVIDQYLFQGLNGPGTSGSISKYAQEGFRRPVMAIEFVPWVETISLTDGWGQRLAKLIGWYEQLGDNQNAQKMLGVLYSAIPDFIESK